MIFGIIINTCVFRTSYLFNLFNKYVYVRYFGYLLCYNIFRKIDTLRGLVSYNLKYKRKVETFINYYRFLYRY